MTGLSPINANLIKNAELNKAQNKHDRVYNNLIVESAVVKPNKAKAVLIKESFPKSVLSAVKDFLNDGKNFFKASATGKMDDNSLGRINDFGMKAGGLLIATFLASQAKTKTSAVMQYIGGSAFFASMALWPKIFINLPAKLVHGFRIDQKYLSAQNEKKDFFLDNQFLPWDAFSEEELRNNAKKAGIDYDSENGDEKIKRKMQKTALQNRTLWMATAGFATPLMTSLFGDWAEPKVKNYIIKRDANKSLNKLNDVDKTLAKSKPIIKNQKEIDAVFADMKSGKISADEMLGRLSKQLSFDMAEVFNSSDDLQPVKNLKYSLSVDQLRELRNQTSSVSEKNLVEILTKALENTQSTTTNEMKKLFGDKLESNIQNFATKEQINAIVEEFKKSDSKSFNTLLNVIHSHLNVSDLQKDVINRRLLDADIQFDDTEFMQQVKDYNTNVLGAVRGRLKEYLNSILNPIMGRKDESLYTDMYRKAMKATMPQKRVKFRFPFYDKETIKMLKDVKSAKKIVKEHVEDGKALELETIDSAIESVSQMFKRIAKLPMDLYTKELEKMLVSKGDNIRYFVHDVVEDTNLNKIASSLTENTANSPLNTSVHELQSWISGNIKNFVNVEEANNNAIRAKGLICANLERRIADNSFKTQLEQSGLISKEFPFEDWARKARYMVYEGTVAADACSLELKNENLYRQLRNIVFDNTKFATEQKYMPELKNVLDGLANLGKTSKDNALVSGLANLEKTFVTEILNNQAWKKVFLPMSVALVAITLLVQPLFGNIKKDFPQDAKGGNN